MKKIDFQNNVTKVNKATFDEFQNNIEEAVNEVQNNIDTLDRIIVSSTEPTTNEKVWFKTDNNSIMVKNDNGEFEEFIKKEVKEDTGWVVLIDYNDWRGKVEARRIDNLIQIRAYCYPTDTISMTELSDFTLATLPEIFIPSKTMNNHIYAKDTNNNLVSNISVMVEPDGIIRFKNVTNTNASMVFYSFNLMYFVD